jgi:hypothetical protein
MRCARSIALFWEHTFGGKRVAELRIPDPA